MSKGEAATTWACRGPF